MVLYHNVSKITKILFFKVELVQESLSLSEHTEDIGYQIKRNVRTENISNPRT